MVWMCSGRSGAKSNEAPMIVCVVSKGVKGCDNFRVVRG